ncbi:hypothetical protein [Psychrobacter sp. DAB_AL43B]|uniref:hypothetical protein n=1 Tax=Psychrobacter sp. DAB_AL43B TaxID=1028416 RepID=UPI0009A5E6A6|nr:hypothetical protein [Psychrobacter sp. DAB_AL43B]SLJ84453.1 hypothetical protein DABAL43B_1257 [Psychrobacter sp. DAB_AL43B]
MSINIAKINEADVMDLADMVQRKKTLIKDMQNSVKRLNDKELVVSINLIPSHSGQVGLLRDCGTLKIAIDLQSEWIIDRIYDTAIQLLENEIVRLAEKLKQNLINATEDKE